MISYYTDIKGDKELILYLNKISSNMKPKIVSGLKEIGKYVEDEAKKKFGSYQRSWPKLKRASVMAKYHRRALGNGVKRPKLNGLANLFNSGIGDDPLILEGTLRDSISHEVNISQLEAVIYSDDKKAATHEYGYKNVPARSYLRLALWDGEDNIKGILSKKVGEAIK